jgi:predicted enzyme related to lactoylglutathione lyase
MDKTIIHFEIPADDVEKLKTFYEGAFGWKITHTPMGNGGMMKKEDPNQGPVNYLSVEDIDWHIAKIKELGGSILMDKSPVPGVGQVAVALDPEGNPVGMVQGEM